jgi:hypothetical protein
MLASGILRIRKVVVGEVLTIGLGLLGCGVYSRRSKLHTTKNVKERNQHMVMCKQTS